MKNVHSSLQKDKYLLSLTDFISYWKAVKVFHDLLPCNSTYKEESHKLPVWTFLEHYLCFSCLIDKIKHNNMSLLKLHQMRKYFFLADVHPLDPAMEEEDR